VAVAVVTSTSTSAVSQKVGRSYERADQIVKVTSMIAVLLSLLGAVAAVPAPAGVSIEAASQAFDEAQFRKDRNLLDQMLAADMRFIRGTGEMAGRDAFLNAFSDPTERFEPFVIERRETVKLGSDIVAVTADGTIRGTGRKGRFENRFRYTDIFRRRGSSWEVVYVQVTKNAN
jgi:hypothetical protein